MARVLVASDVFDYANGDLETVASGIWRSIWAFFGNANVVGNVVKGGNSAGGGERYVGAGSFTAAQYAKITFAGLAFTNDYVGVLLRASAEYDDGNTNTRDTYGVRMRDDNGGDPGNRLTEIYKTINGTTTVLASGRYSWGNADTLEGEVDGTTIRAMKNGAVLFTATDSDLADGRPGFLSVGADCSVTSWEGGNLVADAAAVVSRRRPIVIHPFPGPYNPGQFARRRRAIQPAAALFELTASDTLTPVFSDATSSLLAAASASDTLAPAITDATSSILASVAVSDTLAPAIVDALSALAVTLTTTDSIAPSITDASAVLATLSAADTVTPGISDSSTIAVVIASSDTLAPGITDAISDNKALLSVADSIAVAVVDSLGDIFSTVSASDTVTVQVVDSAALLAALTAADTVAPSLADTAAVLVQLSGGDTLTVSIGDAALVDVLTATIGRLVAVITIKPALSADVDVRPSIDGKPTIN